VKAVNIAIARTFLRHAMEMVIGSQVLPKMRVDDPSSEQALIDRCRRQDVEAFGKFVDLYQNRVFGFVRKMVSNPEEAADVTQDVFIRAYQNFERFDGRSSVRTWLFRIAHNLCIDRARKNDRTPQSVSMAADHDDFEAMDVADTRWQADHILMREELVAIVDAAIGTMSEKLRSVLLLHDREDMPYEEIADLLTIPVGTVKSRLFLARAHLQRALQPYLQAEDAA
jgi:RNA polymerase sigma-70 factor (ECF subfamily)